MKKYVLIVLTIAFSVINLVGALTPPTSADEGGLSCEHLIGCRTKAKCPGRGTASGCTIACEGGEAITCPTGSEEPE